MKLVVTGALGHIGSRFIREMQPGEYREVVLVDNLSTRRYASLFRLPEGVPYRFLETDILTADLDLIFEGTDCVIHLAAVTDAAASFSDPAEAERVTQRGTERVAQACVRAGARLILLSTTSVYGAASGLVDESAEEAVSPQTPYALSKLNAERFLATLSSQGLRFAVLRFGTIYGASPGMRFHTAVNRFVWQASLGLPLTVWRTARFQRRPYLDLTDATRALRFVINRDLFDGEIFNVVTENATVEEVLAVIRRSLPELSVEEVDSPAMNTLSYDVSCARLTALGFTIEGSLESGVSETVEWLRAAGSGIRETPA